MKAFQLIPAIAEYADFGALASELKLGPADLILTNEYIYNPTIASLNLGCHTCFQEKYGGGEPTDVMVDAILDDLRDKDYDRIVAVGGGTVIDIAKVLTVARPSDKVDDLYDRMANPGEGASADHRADDLRHGQRGHQHRDHQPHDQGRQGGPGIALDVCR